VHDLRSAELLPNLQEGFRIRHRAYPQHGRGQLATQLASEQTHRCPPWAHTARSIIFRCG